MRWQAKDEPELFGLPAAQLGEQDLHLNAARCRAEATLRLPPDEHEPRDDREALRRRACRRRAARRDDRRARAANPEPFRNLPVARDDSLPSKVKEPLVFYGVPTRAG